jgi:hypothetical protein
VLIFASVDDLTSGDVPWLSVAPSNAGSLLRSASLIVARETKAAFYDTDDTGMPTDAMVLDAFTQATCAQVCQWVTLGMDPLNLGADSKSPVKSKGLDGAAISYDTSIATSASVLASRQAAAVSLCDQAAEILREAAVLTTRVWGYG